MAQADIALARSLPPKLLKFFSRYPPPTAAFEEQTRIIPTLTPAPRKYTQSSKSPALQSLLLRSTKIPIPNNPFRSHKHPVTGNWHNPKYSLRQQADLVKLARTHGIEGLLPPTIKGTEERLLKRAQHGLQVRGTGVGRRVKGTKAERTLRPRLDKRKQAMLDMPAMVEQWKEVRLHGYSFTLITAANFYTGWPWTGMEEMAQVICRVLG